MIKNGYSFPKNTYYLGNALHVIAYIPKKETTHSPNSQNQKWQPWLFKEFDIRKVGKPKQLFEKLALECPHWLDTNIIQPAMLEPQPNSRL